MSTIAPPRRTFDHDESQRRVRHPLGTLRKYIRAYVLLEGLAVAVLFLAAWFWVGLGIDYGIFRAFAFDWLQELRDIAPDSSNALLVRVVLLAVLVGTVGGLVVTKVAMRWLREFKDSALALVLERRFPHELGDRLITAVELADPKKASRYGYSQAMIEATIQDAVKRIDRLPVAGVFNWRRLVWLWVGVGAATLGMLLAVAIVTCSVGLSTGQLASAGEFPWRFSDVATIFSERNFLVKNTYWPRSAYLELVRFHGKHDSPNEMRVPRDDARGELLVRAVQWVVADPDTADGWRALRWHDLAERNLVDNDLLARVNIPADWPHWIVDLDDLDRQVPSGLVPIALQGRPAGDVRRAILADDLLVRNLKQAEAWDSIEALLDWQRLDGGPDRLAAPARRGTPPAAAAARGDGAGRSAGTTGRARRRAPHEPDAAQTDHPGPGARARPGRYQRDHRGVRVPERQQVLVRSQGPQGIDAHPHAR